MVINVNSVTLVVKLVLDLHKRNVIHVVSTFSCKTNLNVELIVMMVTLEIGTLKSADNVPNNVKPVNLSINMIGSNVILVVMDFN